MPRRAVGIGEDRHRLHAEAPAGGDDAAGDLAAIGNEDALHRRSIRSCREGHFGRFAR